MSNFRHEHIQLDGISLHVVETGDRNARPVVFVHGWPQSWVEWQTVMANAADGFRAIAIDLPGIGESSTAATDGSKRALADVVHRLIEELELDRPTLVGHDAGGMIAYAYLRRYHDVAGVVIIDVVIPGLDPWDEVLRNPYLWHFAFHAIPALPEQLVQGHQDAYLDYFFDILAVDPARITTEARAAYARAYASETALTAGFDLYRAFPQDAKDNLAETTATVDTPTLYVRGKGSRGDLDSYANGLRAAGVENLSAELIADAGHFIPDEQPAALWQAIDDFIVAALRR
jgi:pimeloyl-ACP methyl ester carboxylesterase